MPTHLDNEQSLVAAAQAGDSDAFVTLLNQYSRHIYRLGVSITGNHHDAEDVLQEASLKAYRAIAEFQGNSRFYTWLVRIAVNVALGKLRKRALWKESSLDEPRESEDGSYIPLEIGGDCQIARPVHPGSEDTPITLATKVARGIDQVFRKGCPQCDADKSSIRSLTTSTANLILN